jgi:hypothetical protein
MKLIKRPISEFATTPDTAYAAPPAQLAPLPCVPLEDDVSTDDIIDLFAELATPSPPPNPSPSVAQPHEPATSPPVAKQLTFEAAAGGERDEPRTKRSKQVCFTYLRHSCY